MAVLQMQRINICALKKDRKQILEVLQRRGVVEPCDLKAEDELFQQSDTSQQQAQFEKNASAARQALEILNNYAPVKTSMLSSLEGRKAISEAEYRAFEAHCEETLEMVNRISGLSKQIAEQNAETVRLQTQLDTLVPWLPLEVPMQFKGTAHTAAFIGSFPEEVTMEAIYQKLAQACPDAVVNVDMVTQSPDITCVFVLTLSQTADAVEDALRAMGFTLPVISCKGTAAEQKQLLEQELKQVNGAIEQAKAQIISLAEKRPEIQMAVDFYTMRAEKYGTLGHLLQSKRTFFLSGYIPAAYAGALQKELEGKFDVAVSLEEPGEDEDVPVLLKNNNFVAPVESVIESYSLPARGESDPSSLVAIFYYFLFGLMLSDFGYGLILFIATFIILKKFKNMEPGMRRSMQLFCYCGISTMFWGVLFSSYFGDVVDIVSQTFFGCHATIPPLWFAPLNDPMKLLVFSMAVGVAHLFVGLGAKLYECLKHKQYYDAFASSILWYMLVGGLIVYGLSTDLLVGIMQISFRVPASIGSVAAWIAAVGAVGVVITGGDSKNIAARLAQGLYSLYNVTGYLSDILSYSRLLALGLATGVVGSVVNQMGAMVGGGVVGAIVFILVFLIGHSLNFGIELLGAYVHCNRLQYVEFFGKFYDGGGRKFSPFAVHTKYYKFKEDN